MIHYFQPYTTVNYCTVQCSSEPEPPLHAVRTDLGSIYISGKQQRESGCVLLTIPFDASVKILKCLHISDITPILKRVRYLLYQIIWGTSTSPLLTLEMGWVFVHLELFWCPLGLNLALLDTLGRLVGIQNTAKQYAWMLQIDIMSLGHFRCLKPL